MNPMSLFLCSIDHKRASHQWSVVVEKKIDFIGEILPPMAETTKKCLRIKIHMISAACNLRLYRKLLLYSLNLQGEGGVVLSLAT